MPGFPDLLVFLIPIYIANSSPVVLGGGAPLDFGATAWDGRRLLGDSKTVRGFIGGVLAGTVAGGILAVLYPLPFFPDGAAQFTAGFALSFGALAGDALGSFAKRRVGVESGKPFVPDTLVFLVFALAFAFPFTAMGLYSPLNLLFFAALTMVLHPLTNLLANRVGLKKVPW